MRFDNTKFRSLNETITHLNEPQVAVDEYTELLESVLLALCEELELDPNKLLEDYQTPERAATTRRAAQQAKTLDWYERTSPHTYGKGGRLVKKAKTKRALSAGQKVNGFVKSLYK